MKWNNNDTKYIIKRIVIYFLIAFAMFIIGTWKASALIVTNQLDLVGNTYEYTFQSAQTTKEIDLKRNAFQGLGEGSIIATFRTGNVSSGTEPINQIRAFDNNGVQYVCDIGNQQNYVDNTTMRYTITAVCPMDLRGTNVGLRGFYLTRGGAYGTLQVIIGDYVTFTQNNNESAVIVSAINTATQQQITNNNTNSQAMQTAINTAVTNATAETNQKLDNINNSINNDNITSSDADNFANNGAFSDTTGLESVINLPLNMVNSLSNQCVPIQIHIPYIEADATIPCMSTIYRSKFNNLYTLVKLVVNGFLVYRILLKVYELVHEAKQPDEDKLEVIEL